MICKNCNTENITKAGYCKNCGTAFTQEERDAAYSRTIYGKLDKIHEKWEKITSVLNLSIITDHPVVKYGLLVVILVFGLLAGRPNGDKMLVLENNGYSVQQNTTNGDYYIMAEGDSVTLSLYLPQQAESLNIQQHSSEGYIMSDFYFSTEDAIVLSADAENYYSICANYTDSTETIKLYVLMK